MATGFSRFTLVCVGGGKHLGRSSGLNLGLEVIRVRVQRWD